MMRTFTAALLSLAVFALGCAGANGQGQSEAPGALSSNETTGGELSQGTTQATEPVATNGGPPQASIERRIQVARRLYRDLAFQASLDELRRAQEELEARLDAETTYPSLDDIVLMRWRLEISRPRALPCARPSSFAPNESLSTPRSLHPTCALNTSGFETSSAGRRLYP